MSTVTVYKSHSIDGVLTNATTFTLGVVRADTGAVVVAAGTAMTNTATGKYQYAFTEPAANLTYTVSYSLTYAGNTTAWEESVGGTVTDAVPLPDLTGDTLVDTLNSLLIERLQIIRAGPKPTYSLHGHLVKWDEYLSNLDQRILAIRREIAASSPVEVIGVAW